MALKKKGGSSNIDVNISVGTIFSILHPHQHIVDLDDFLQLLSDFHDEGVYFTS